MTNKVETPQPRHGDKSRDGDLQPASLGGQRSRSAGDPQAHLLQRVAGIHRQRFQELENVRGRSENGANGPFKMLHIVVGDSHGDKGLHGKLKVLADLAEGETGVVVAKLRDCAIEFDRDGHVCVCGDETFSFSRDRQWFEGKRGKNCWEKIG